MNKGAVTKLAIDRDGLMKETGIKEININTIENLQEIDYLPAEHEIVLQPLPEKESTTASGIVIPGYVANKNEFKCAVIATSKESKYVRGQVVRLDPNFYAVKDQATGQVHLRVPTDYICGKPVLQCPEHFIKGVYTNIDLSNWK
jgi:hypothetical protein